MVYDSDMLYAGYTSGTIRIFTIAEGKLSLKQETRVHDFGVNCIAAI